MSVKLLLALSFVIFLTHQAADVQKKSYNKPDLSFGSFMQFPSISYVKLYDDTREVE